jgi:hypothetical protein
MVPIRTRHGISFEYKLLSHVPNEQYVAAIFCAYDFLECSGEHVRHLTPFAVVSRMCNDGPSTSGTLLRSNGVYEWLVGATSSIGAADTVPPRITSTRLHVPFPAMVRVLSGLHR